MQYIWKIQCNKAVSDNWKKEPKEEEDKKTKQKDEKKNIQAENVKRIYPT